jgi:hypothetical protein
VGNVLRRLGIRFAAILIGIAVGLALSDALLDGFSASTTDLVEATIVFWIVNMIVNFLALRVLIRNPSVATAGLLALASTIVSLFIVNLVVTGVSIRGTAYLGATLIVWVTTTVATILGGRRIRDTRGR